MSASLIISQPVYVPGFVSMASLNRFTVTQYHRMIETGVLTDEDRVELLEGYLVLKMPKGTSHESAMTRLLDILPVTKPAGWVLRSQGPVTFMESEPEPDFLIARGVRGTYDTRHPGPADVGLLIEVSDSSLARDRTDKARIFARERIPVYWIVNCVDRQIEVYTDPTGPGTVPAYRHRQDYLPGSVVPLVLDGVTVGSVAVDEVLA